MVVVRRPAMAHPAYDNRCLRVDAAISILSCQNSRSVSFISVATDIPVSLACCSYVRRSSLLLVSRGEDSAGAEGSGDGLRDIVGLFRSINRFRTAGGLVAGCLFVQPCCRNVLVAQSLAF